MPRGSRPGERRGGRKAGTPNKATSDVRAYAGKYTKEAIEGLVQLARSAESEQARVASWREVLDRGCGKPAQAVTGPDGEALQVPASIAFVIRQQDGAENRS
jgi:hypothetical protein